MTFLRIIRITRHTQSKLILRFLADSAKPYLKHLPVLHCDMPHAVIEIIPRRKHIVGLCCECLRSHIGSRQLAGRLSLPVLIYLMQRLLCILRYVEWICRPLCNRIKFCLQPLKREFGEYLTAPWLLCRASKQQLTRPYHNRDIRKNLLKCQCTSGDNRHPFRLLVGFRQQNCTVRLNLRQPFVQIVDKRRNPWALCDWLRIILHTLPPSYFISLRQSAKP